MNNDTSPVAPDRTGAAVTSGATKNHGEALMAKKQAFKFWEAPHLFRRDGSFTNW